MISLRVLSFASGVALAAVSPGWAQTVPSDPRERPLDAPRPNTSTPTIPPPLSADRGGLPKISPRAPRVMVANIRLTDADRFMGVDFEAVLQAYRGRALSAAEIEALRQDLTRSMIAAGFVNSGALIAADAWRDETLTVDLVAGGLEEVVVSTDRFLLRKGLLSRPLFRGTGRPLDVTELNDAFRALLDDPLVDQVQASLRPGSRLGEAVLDAKATLAPRVTGFVGADNARPASAGEYAGRLGLTFNNLTGLGERLTLIGSGSSGAGDGGFDLTIPLTARGTRLIAAGSVGRTNFIEEPLDVLDIESEFSAFSVGVRRDLRLDERVSFGLEGRFERRRGATFLDGAPFAFAPGTEGDLQADGAREDVGVSRTYALRLSQSGSFGTERIGAALRLTESVGLDAFDATVNPEGPDGRFFALLGQARLTARPFRDGFASRFAVDARFDGQYATSRLLPIEQFALGGLRTVRGFRENSIVSDQGAVGSVEVRFRLVEFALPGPLKGQGPGPLELAFFFDGGIGADRDVPGGRDTLLSVGPGLRWRPNGWIDAQVYYGVDLTDAPAQGSALQDEGVHFSVRFTPPVLEWWRKAFRRDGGSP